MSTRRPWFKFHPRDWRSDEALQKCSLAARGLWIECLCIMHEATPYGHLVIDGKPVAIEALAGMAGTTVARTTAVMAELTAAGVLSVTGDGVVLSRRMVRDHKRAQKGRASVKRRWSQTAGAIEKSDAPNRSPNRLPNRSTQPGTAPLKGPVPGGPDLLPHPDWERMTAFFEATGSWLGLQWPDPREAPPEYRDRLKGAEMA